MKSSGEYKAPEVRNSLKGRVSYDAKNVRRYVYRPFDMRLAYLDADIAPLFSRPSPTLIATAAESNGFLVVREKAGIVPASPPLFFSRFICDYHCMSVEAKHIPLRVSRTLGSTRSRGQNQLSLNSSDFTPNLSRGAQSYLLAVVKAGSEEVASHDELWMHCLAIGYSPAYLRENTDGIGQDWPRIPLPGSGELLLRSAELGRRVADLLDPETDVERVTSGNVRSELKVIGGAWRVDGENLNERASDLAVTAGWGHGGQGGVIVPGKGKTITRPYASEDLAAIGQGAEALGLSLEEALAQLGETTVDVYLNDVAYWRCVPSRVWSYTIGGYQVMKKWLSYREKALLGRDLKTDEVREVTRMARRIAAILLLQPQLDANYLAVKGATWEWGR